MPKDRTILIFENPFTLSNYLLRQWFALAQESIAKNNRFTVALSGGKTPLEFYCKLSGAKEYDQWDQTHVFLTDERFVDSDDEASNGRMLADSLLDYVHIPQENIHPIHTNTGDVSVSAECYEEELIDFYELAIGQIPCFDFLLLGLGEDGHTASLFPGEKHIAEKVRLAVFTETEKFGYQRISLSLPVINQARHIFFIVTGKNKAAIVKKILYDKKEYPARKVMPVKGDITFLLDKDAASDLPYFSSYTHCDEAIRVQY